MADDEPVAHERPGKPSLAKLGVSTGLGMTASQAYNLLTALAVAHLVNAAGQGRFMLFVSLTVVASQLSRLGLNEALPYLLPKYELDHVGRQRALSLEALAGAMVLSVLAGGAFYLGANWIDGSLISIEGFDHELRLLVLSIPLMTAMSMGNSVLRGLHRSDLRSVALYHINTGGMLLACAVVFALSLTSLDSLYAARIVVFGVAAAFAVGAAFAKLPSQHEPLDSAARRQLWGFGGLMVLAGVFTYLVQQPLVDLMVVAHYADAATVGVYAVASKISVFVIFVPTALDIVLGPSLARAVAAQDDKRVAHEFRRGAEWMALAGVGFAGLSIVLREPLLGVFGQVYRGGTDVLIILVVSRLAIAFLGPVTPLVLAVGAVKQQFWLTAFSGALFFATVWPLAIAAGAEGVALATGLTLASLQVGRYLLCRRHRPGLRLPATLVRIGSAGALGTVAGLGAAALPLSTTMLPLVSAAVFVAVFAGGGYLLGLTNMLTAMLGTMRRQLLGRGRAA